MGQMRGYTPKVGETSVRARSLQDAQTVVTEHVTDLPARGRKRPRRAP
ncbi:hypothetical protein LUW75_09665 [Streptomyces sp. MRC013]|nr:hypothetical protein [Streptomyces sp. MRC013]URM90212.1 hypothetical protein LUW75_09665 [Streptomyces sp. MRC013]